MKIIQTVLATFVLISISLTAVSSVRAQEVEVLSLQIDPVVREEAGFLVLASDSLVTIMLSSTPTQAEFVNFYIAAGGTGSEPVLMSTDTDLSDGAIVEWLIGVSTLGYLSATVHDANGQVIAITNELAIVADTSIELPKPQEDVEYAVFTHDTLGFQLEVPSDWVARGFSDGVILSQGTLELIITGTPPSGLPAGDRITYTMFTVRGNVDVRRENLVYQERTKSVIYTFQGLEQIPLGENAISIMLIDNQFDYEAINLSEDVLLEVDQIVATLTNYRE